MKFIYARHADQIKREAFFATNKHLNNDQFLKDGYLVEKDAQIIGCFMIERVTVDTYWLKQLYITQSAAELLPSLLEMVLMFAKQRQVKKIYVFSHQPTVDIILEALQFQEEHSHPIVVNSHNYSSGKWWTYNVS